MRAHKIVGTEAFDYSDHRLAPAYGSLRRFSGRRLHRFRHLRQAWPLVFVAAAAAGAIIGRVI